MNLKAAPSISNLKPLALGVANTSCFLKIKPFFVAFWSPVTELFDTVNLLFSGQKLSICCTKSANPSLRNNLNLP